MTRDQSLDVAVTGTSVLVPGASTTSEWWAALVAGEVVCDAVPANQVAAAGANPADPTYVPVHGLLASADDFDPEHFGMSERAAELTDPQLRKLLEVGWLALEDAGHAPGGRLPVTGVFASTSGSPYLRRILMSGSLDNTALEQVLHGCEPDFVASTLAYRLNLTGPALNVQTACSSGLVALHVAIQSLLNGDCDQALVVAAGIDHPQAGHWFVPGGIASRSGRCRPFSVSADGVVAGSGAVGLVLRRFADAQRERLTVDGVVIGSAVNNDGVSKAGYFAPSPSAQEAVIRAAFAAAGVDASSLGYLETHGTGTAVGDPIEWSAASAALTALGAQPGQVPIGALKANIGHLDSASGLASVVKALLVLREGTIPPVAGFDGPNPLIDVKGSPLVVPTTASPWLGPEPRRAAVSSFGIGGTNAHVVLEQAPVEPALKVRDGAPTLVLLSARDADALTTVEADIASALAAGLRPGIGLADVSWTLAVGRASLPVRSAVVASTTDELAVRLTHGRGVVRGKSGPRPTEVVLLFPGQGAEAPGMAAPLAAALPGFSAALDRCIACFAPDVAAEVAEAVLDPSFPEARLATTELAQPALFSVGTAAAVALRDLGIRPVAVIGHSLGELIAATIAGVLPLRDACRVVTARARAMQACPPGAMAALWCNEEQAQALIAPYRGRIEVAAVNGPSMSVVSGAVADVERLLTELPDALPGRRLPADRAFHSWMVEPARVAIEKAVATAHLAPAEVALALTGSGRLVPAGDEVAPDALIDQARLPVQFDRALAAIVEVRPDAVGLEVGPGRTLSALASARMLWVEPLLRDGARSGGDEVLAALGALWVRGVPVDPSAVIRSGRRVHLPTYPFGGRRIVAPEAVGPPPTRTGRAHEAELPPARDEIVAAAVVAGNDAAADSLTLLSALWAELLGADSVDREADFIDLGGDSLLMTELGNRITRRFGVTVPLRDLMLARTLDAHAKVVQRYVIASAGSEGEASASSDHRPKPDDD